MITKHVSIIFFAVFTLIFSAAKAEQIYAIPKPQFSASGKSVSDLKPVLVEKPTALDYDVSPRIVGGTNTALNEFPEFVQLWVSGSAIGGDPNSVYPFCGGTLISSNKVLTAAHCSEDFSAGDLYAYPNFYSFSSATSGGLIPVSAKAEHPSYVSPTTGFDISVLTLNGSATTAKASVYGGSNLLAGSMATVIGTGDLSDGGNTYPDVLQKVDIPIVTNEVCKASYGSSVITDDMLCAGLVSGGKDSCQGDSGGPLWVSIQGKKAQAGVVSWGIGCALPNYYGVYARTTALIDFIKANAPSAAIIVDGADQNDDDDFLLMVIPAIVAAANLSSPPPPPPTDPLAEIKKLSGDWIFHYAPPGYVFDIEFRFYRDTAAVDSSNPFYTLIAGDEFLNNFTLFYHTNVAGLYDSQNKFYAVLDLWGPPSGYDAGSFFVFSTTTGNNSRDCHYYTDGQGNIRNYYIGFGGTLPCEQLTKFQTAVRSIFADSPSLSVAQAQFERYESVLNLIEQSSKSMSVEPVINQQKINAYTRLLQAAKTLLNNE